MMSCIYLVAGEASGDYLGSRLMKALQEKDPNLSFRGIGGPLMEGQGLRSLFPMSDLSHMGIWEVLKHLPVLRRRLVQTIDDIKTNRPSVVVTIDSPDFSFRVGKAIRKIFGKDIFLVHYGAPTVWAWRPERAQKISKFLDHLLTLFDFEPPYFEKVGLPCTFVGHPLMEEKAWEKTLDKEVFRGKRGIPLDAPILCLLPGSRLSEVRQLLPIFLETFGRLKKKIPSLHGVLPLSTGVAPWVRERILGEGAIHEVSHEEKWQAFGNSTAALAASGTVVLELALAGIPTCLAYKVSPLTALIGRLLIKIPYVGLPNILLKEEIVGEFLQEKCQVSFLEEALEEILTNPEKSSVLRQRLQTVQAHLVGSVAPSHLAAEVVLKGLSISSKILCE